jgi:copper chaperone NosL
MKQIRKSTRILIAVLSVAMAAAYFVPLWQILMWAPQYPEGLEMKIWIDDLSGDVKIISALNHYIGMRHIEVSMFPEFLYMTYIVAALIGVGLIASAIGRRIALLFFTSLVLITGIAALVDFYMWGYEYGHNLNPEAPIVVPGMYYQPPLIGTKQLLNFTAFSGPDIGGWVFVILAAGLITLTILEYFVYGKQKA